MEGASFDEESDVKTHLILGFHNFLIETTLSSNF